MEVFNRANTLIHDILVAEDYVLDIGFDDEFSPDFLYQSGYPLVIPEQSMTTRYHFVIQLFRYCSNSHSLKIIELKYSSAPKARIIYVHGQDLIEADNIFGKNLIKKENFLNHVKPLILEGFREIAFVELIGKK